MHEPVLVLNANFEPINICTTRRAVGLLLAGKADMLRKLTENMEVSNQKIKKAIGKPLPVSSKEGLLKTIRSFQ